MSSESTSPPSPHPAPILPTADTRARIESRLRTAFLPIHLEVEDESHRHAGHVGAREGGGHFSATIVSAGFEGVSRVERHRRVFALFPDEFKGKIHALTVQAFSPAEWETRRETLRHR